MSNIQTSIGAWPDSYDWQLTFAFSFQGHSVELRVRLPLRLDNKRPSLVRMPLYTTMPSFIADPAVPIDTFPDDYLWGSWITSVLLGWRVYLDGETIMLDDFLLRHFEAAVLTVPAEKALWEIERGLGHLYREAFPDHYARWERQSRTGDEPMLGGDRAER